MSNRLTHLLLIALALGSAAAAALAYPRLPEQVATHWNAAGEVDAHGPRLTLLAMAPLVLMGFYALFLVVPRIDPHRRNIEVFRRTFNGFVVSLAVFMVYVQGLTLAWNLGARFDMARLLAPALGGLFFAAGVLLAQARPSWFIGIRTPWTLSSEAVWQDTHRIGSRLFKAAGVAALLGVFLPGTWFFAMVIGLAVAIAAWSFVYSYVAYRRETQREP